MKLFIISLVLFFTAGVVAIAEEQPTKTFYNNKIPYSAFFVSPPDTNDIKVQIGNKQGIIPVVNDPEKDLTQKDESEER